MNGQNSVINVSGWLRQGFALFKDNAMVLIIATLLALVLSGATSGILAGPMFAGLAILALSLVDRQSPALDIGAVFKGFDFFLNAFLLWLVWTVVFIVICFLLGLVPVIGKPLAALAGVVLKTLLVFALFLIVDRKMEFWPASLESVGRVKADFLPLFGFVLALAVIVVLGTLFTCGLGALVTVPFAVCCLAAAYRDLFGPAPAGA